MKRNREGEETAARALDEKDSLLPAPIDVRCIWVPTEQLLTFPLVLDPRDNSLESVRRAFTSAFSAAVSPLTPHAAPTAADKSTGEETTESSCSTGVAQSATSEGRTECRVAFSSLDHVLLDTSDKCVDWFRRSRKSAGNGGAPSQATALALLAFPTDELSYASVTESIIAEAGFIKAGTVLHTNSIPSKILAEELFVELQGLLSSDDGHREQHTATAPTSSSLSDHVRARVVSCIMAAVVRHVTASRADSASSSGSQDLKLVHNAFSLGVFAQGHVDHLVTYRSHSIFTALVGHGPAGSSLGSVIAQSVASLMACCEHEERRLKLNMGCDETASRVREGGKEDSTSHHAAIQGTESGSGAVANASDAPSSSSTATNPSTSTAMTSTASTTSTTTTTTTTSSTTTTTTTTTSAATTTHPPRSPEAWGLATTGHVWVLVRLRPPVYTLSRVYPLPLDPALWTSEAGAAQVKACLAPLVDVLCGVLRERMEVVDEIVKGDEGSRVVA